MENRIPRKVDASFGFLVPLVDRSVNRLALILDIGIVALLLVVLKLS